MENVLGEASKGPEQRQKAGLTGVYLNPRPAFVHIGRKLKGSGASREGELQWQ